MIFVTVGAQTPFDRLISSVDRWAGQRGRTDVYAQIGETNLRPQNIRWTKFDDPEKFRQLVESADAIVAHAGMGTILTALELGKPIIVMPRRGALNETRNDHQVATARQFVNQGLVSVAWDENELMERLDSVVDLRASEKISHYASDALCDTLTEFINRPRAGIVDGIICFGGVDWWYHNRGHYDVRLMREFSRHMPVLYVNSIGMRTPKLGEGAVFFGRVLRKCKSWARGLRLVRNNFAVLSPVSIPKFHSKALGKVLMAEQVRDAAAWMGIKHPLVWVACPPAAEVIDRIPAVGLLYQRTDRFEHFPGVDVDRIREYDIALKEEADLTLFCSTSVFEEEKSQCRMAAFVDHGVDYDDFAAAGDGSTGEPEDMRSIGRPRVGFVGGIDAHTFDPDLFLEVASGMPDCSFVLVGACSLPVGWCELENVHFLGRKPYEQVASYMAACDVLIMPWNRNSWIKACNPVKLKEYLAVARPIVSTPFDELGRYDGLVSIAEDGSEFVKGIRKALDTPRDMTAMRRRVENETWSAKFASVICHLEEEGVEFRPHSFPTESGASDLDAASRPTKKSGGPLSASEPSEAAVSLALTSDPDAKKYWKPWHFLAATLIAFIGVWVTSDAWIDIFRLASTDEESSHIWLVLPVAAWLAWARKEQALLLRRTGTLVGPLLVCFGWLLYTLGDTQLIQSFWHLGAIIIVTGCALSVLGGSLLVRLWPVFAVLVFLVPVPGLVRQQIALPLQSITAEATAFILETLGTEVVLSGNALLINGVAVGIAEACNGLRMIFALALVCYLFAFGSRMSNAARLFVLAASPIIAVIANITRLVPTVWLYGYAKEETASMFHVVSGWAMMPAALLTLVGLGAVIRWALSVDVKRNTDAPRAVISGESY